MLWLALCIVFTSFLIIGFKYFQQYHIHTLPGITINYFTCAALAFLSQNNYGAITQLTFHPWIFLTIALGTLFIIVFTIIGYSTIQNGVTITTIANKLSVVIPISIALIIYGEKITGLKIAGIVLAIISVVLSNMKPNEKNSSKRNILLTVMLFIGSGIVDSFVNYIQRFHLPSDSNQLFISIAFGTACIGGLLASIIKKDSFGKKEIIAGVLLGIPNFGSIFCILKALQNPAIEDSVVWTINNVGVIVFSTLYAVFIFKERLNNFNVFGIIIAVAAILMMTLSQ